jgi:hypothetical protein
MAEKQQAFSASGHREVGTAIFGAICLPYCTGFDFTAGNCLVVLEACQRPQIVVSKGDLKYRTIKSLAIKCGVRANRYKARKRGM